ncbi:DNA primase [Commensalibacter oyaizuii]|uniref:DNA primase n=1 Tax=Commensalibacter oyaizuii TaxID=3043873 RepID=A0ABT6Q0X1_9PROT|nr:DNA primase [Commensalibacter sp. TBRC 16381]MDI2090633.1 DNA primase [Commensalibacter sp. TBRC 16381]
MAFDQQFLEELRQRVPLHSIIARKVKVARSGRHWKACCPFHGEKTPSFYIYDDHFHCYGCGAHGDVISFVMQNEGKSFSEALYELAALAGLEVPQQSPQQKERQEQQHNLYELMAAAHQYYLDQFKSPRAKVGRDYLMRRGISEHSINQFGLCWSGDGRGGLIDYLKGMGYSIHHIGEAGLLRKQSDDQWGGELFFNRVMFPIFDRRNRVIAFGGRILGDGQPKYLNSPETPLFAKRRVLYGLNNLGSIHSRKDIDPLYNTVLVVEGYMDVIALYQAGFHGAVAPLGTALTQDQMRLLWRATPKPVLCFDGDSAGHRAMLHAAEEALPILTSQQTLNFITLPEKEDPDSFIQNQGEKAFLELIRNKRNLSDTLYEISVELMVDTSPEQRAALRDRLSSIANQIKEPNLSKEYRKVLFDRFYAQFYSKDRRFRTSRKDKTFETLRIIRPVIQENRADYERMCILVALLVYCPSILPSVEEAFCRLGLPKNLADIREVIMENAESCENIKTTLQARGMDSFIEKTLNSSNFSLYYSDSDINTNEQSIERKWWHFYGLLNIQELKDQVDQAQKAWVASPDEQRQRTFIARLKALEMVKRGEENAQDEEV